MPRRTRAPVWGLPPHYVWAVVALALALVVFYFSDRTYAVLSKPFVVVMFTNIALVLVVTAIAAKPEHCWVVLKGHLGTTFLAEDYPDALPKTDALALFNQPGGSLITGSAARVFALNMGRQRYRWRRRRR